MTQERFLVTGALGCIGSWVVRRLHAEGAAIVATDLGHDRRRWRLLDPSLEHDVQVHELDVTDGSALSELVADQGITRLIHLAALQVPIARAHPLAGARVNVEGMTAVLEAARAHRDQVRGLAFASSVAVYGPASAYPPGPLAHDAQPAPTTLYGAHKQCDEWLARVYAADYAVPSVGLRPLTVYGPGRDQGVTSSPTQAMLAAAAGKPYRIAWGGESGYAYAEDVAAAFIAAARAADDGGPADTYNLPVETADMPAVVAAITREVPGATIEFEPAGLPFATAVDGAAVRARLGRIPETSFADGVRSTVATFRRALDEGRLDLDTTLA
ncbi:MAG: NAD(P)-dependent oxidoreductase [Candidatus Dormiibacterota bacterium]